MAARFRCWRRFTPLSGERSGPGVPVAAEAAAAVRVVVPRAADTGLQLSDFFLGVTVDGKTLWLEINAIEIVFFL
jgi:hypothetical protein